MIHQQQPLFVIGRANRCDLAYLSATIEAYEGIATLSVLDGKNGTVQFSFFCHLTQNAAGLIFALQDEIGMEIFLPCEGPVASSTTRDFLTSHAATV